MFITSSQLLIGGVDYSAYADAPSFDVQDTVIMTKDTFTLNIELAGELPRPTESQEILWVVDNVREFGGVIQSVLEIDLGTSLQYQVSAVSYERWLDRHLVVNYYEQLTADQMIKNIIGSFTHGFTTNNVQPSYTIPPLFFNYVRVSDAIKQIADQIEWGWYVDYYKDVHFFPIEKFVSPLPNNSLYADGNTDTSFWGDLQLTEDGSQKKTRIYLKGFKARVGTPVTLNFNGDGQATQFSLGYKPSYHKGDITVTVGGTAYKVVRDVADGTPGQGSSAGVAYINYYQHFVRFATAPAAGTVVTVQMYYLSDTILMRQNPRAAQIAAQRDGDGYDGRYEYAHTDPALTNSTIDAANAKGDQLLYQYAYPQLQAEFTSFQRGWRSGQYFYLRSNRRMGGQYDGQQMFIQSVQKKLVSATPNGPTVIRYDIKAASTPYLV